MSEGSNDAWLLSHNPPPPPPQTQSAPGAAGPVLSTPAARRGDAADRSVQDSSAGKSAAPTPFLDASAKDKEAPAPAGEEEEGWSEEQDLMVLMAGKAAAQDPAPSAYEESWKRLNRCAVPLPLARCQTHSCMMCTCIAAWLRARFSLRGLAERGLAGCKGDACGRWRGGTKCW